MIIWSAFPLSISNRCDFCFTTESTLTILRELRYHLDVTFNSIVSCSVCHVLFGTIFSDYLNLQVQRFRKIKNYLTCSAYHRQQSGAVEACWAHNPEVRGSKPRSAKCFLFYVILFYSLICSQNSFFFIFCCFIFSLNLSLDQ